MTWPGGIASTTSSTREEYSSISGMTSPSFVTSLEHPEQTGSEHQGRDDREQRVGGEPAAAARGDGGGGHRDGTPAEVRGYRDRRLLSGLVHELARLGHRRARVHD